MQKLMASTLPSLVFHYAEAESGTRTAIVDESGRRLSYRDLAGHATYLARGLRRLGVQKGDVVGLLAPNSVDWVVALLGAQLSGATVAAFHTWVKPHDLQFLLRHSEAKVLIVAPSVGQYDLLDPVLKLLPELATQVPGEWKSHSFPSLEAVVLLGEGDTVPSGILQIKDVAAAGAGSDEPLVEPDPAAVGIVLYTSGSTADPKGVPLLQGDMLENGFQIGERMRLRAADRVWLGSPLFWSFGAANALVATFTHQATLVVEQKFDPALAAQQIATESCTAAYLLPAMVYALADIPDVATLFATVRTGLTIGRSEEIEMVVKRLGIAEICNIYGSTETYGNCCVTPCDIPLEVRLRSQGPPLPGFQMRIVDEATGQELGPGEIGAVYVRGRLTPGYFKAPDLNRDTFTPDGWYRTGDMGLLDSDGYFSFVTRSSDMIKTNGINVSPAEIEEFIAGGREVAEVVVVGAPDPVRGQVIVAFAKAAPGCSVQPDDVIRRCREGMATYKVPHLVYVVDQIPLTATGKLSRKLLLELLPDRQPTATGSD